MKLSVIIPVYNELNTLIAIIEKVREVNLDMEIILVDDFSTDGTRDLYPKISHLVDKVVLHEFNQGKGAAIRTGLQHVTGEVTVIQDADLEYDPQEFIVMLEPIAAGKADVVYGSRFLSGRPHRVLYFWHTVGNRFLTLLSNMLTNLNLTDMETCYKMARTKCFKAITIEQNRFGFEPEITAKFSKMHALKIYEVGISYDGRSYAAGKKIGWKDGVNAIWCILKYSRGSGIDVGKNTLEILSSFDAYSSWMLSKFRSYFRNKTILEVGSGIGNNVKNYFPEADHLILSDCREDYVADLAEKFRHVDKVKTELFDLEKDAPDTIKEANPEVVTCLNVLEHVPNDEAAIANIYNVLAPGGFAVVLVPAHQSLFCDLDKRLDHHRRYDKESLTLLMRNAGFEVKEVSYFNTLGAIGWWISGKVFRNGTIGHGHVKAQELLLPISKAIDSLNFPFGLSVYCIAEKK